VETTTRNTLAGLAALATIGLHAPATASCDISGSNVMFQGIEKRDGASTGTAQKPAQSKAALRETSTATPANPPR
jgi:hypothetical protein